MWGEGRRDAPARSLSASASRPTYGVRPADLRERSERPSRYAPPRSVTARDRDEREQRGEFNEVKRQFLRTRLCAMRSKLHV
jgi:hypothetical protein